MGVHPWRDRYRNMLLEQFAVGDVLRGIQMAEVTRAMLRQSQLSTATAGTTAMFPAATAERTFSSSSDSSAAGDDQSQSSLYDDAVLEVTLSAEPSLEGDESPADLAVDVTDWAVSGGSSGGSSNDCCSGQMVDQSDCNDDVVCSKGSMLAADNGRLSVQDVMYA